MNDITLPTLETMTLFADQMTSVVSFPQRCSLWGQGRYPGNCDGRLFLGLVLRWNAKRIADPMLGSGTTRDAIHWLNRHGGPKRNFWGGDLRTGFNLYRQDLPRSYDLVWVHPPYWNIIQYSREPEDLSNLSDYREYLRRLNVCLKRCHAALEPRGRLAVLIGDVRRRGTYVPIVRDVLNMAPHIGDIQAVLIKQQHACRSDRKAYGPMPDPRIQHEYCVVFQRRA